jgi:hypothetical protein
MLEIAMSAEVIGLLLPETDVDSTEDDFSATATLLLRRSNGRIELREVESDVDYLKRWPTTGCFRKGRPITDPETGKVLGYEMEQVAFG